MRPDKVHSFEANAYDYNTKGRKIMALKMMGLTDTQISRAIGAAQSSVFMYRNVPDSLTDKFSGAIDQLIKTGIADFQKVAKALKKEDEATHNLIMAIIAYAKDSLEGN